MLDEEVNGENLLAIADAAERESPISLEPDSAIQSSSTGFISIESKDGDSNLMRIGLEIIPDEEVPLPAVQIDAVLFDANEIIPRSLLHRIEKPLDENEAPVPVAQLEIQCNIDPGASVLHKVEKPSDVNDAPLPVAQIAVRYEYGALNNTGLIAGSVDQSCESSIPDIILREFGDNGITDAATHIAGPVEPLNQPSSSISYVLPNSSSSLTIAEENFSGMMRELPVRIRTHSDQRSVSSQTEVEEDLDLPYFTVENATLVDDVVYDAILVQESMVSRDISDHVGSRAGRRKRHEWVLVGFVLSAIVAMAIVIATQGNKPSGSAPSLPQTNNSTLPQTSPLMWKQRGKTIAENATYDTLLGASFALSSDGSTLAVGAPGPRDFIYPDQKPGYVKVYWSGDGESLTQRGHDIVGDAIRDRFGSSVSLSSDGRTIAIGSPGSPGTTHVPMAGYVRVLRMIGDNNSSWHQLGQDIDGEAIDDNFGSAVSLSQDGRTVAVGAWTNDGNGDSSGHVRIYQIESATSKWKQIGQEIDGNVADEGAGYAVSLSANGMTVVIGSPRNSRNGKHSGHMKVYTYDTSAFRWKQLGQDIYGKVMSDYLGHSVDISGDGQSIAIGAPGLSNELRGYIQVFTLEVNNSSSRWRQVGQAIEGDSLGDYFGFSVSLSSAGRTVAVGAPSSNVNAIDAGYVMAYRLEDGGNWTRLGNEITGEVAFAQLGSLVSLVVKSNEVVIGTANLKNGQAELFSLEV